MNQETWFLELLRATTGFEIDKNGALIIITKDGRSILARSG